MRASWIIAKRELLERIGSRSFLFMAVFGPLLVLLLVYVLFAVGGNDQQKWKVLVSDQYKVLDNKIMANEDPNIQYYFYNDVIEIEEFAHNERFQKFDAMVEVNGKVLSNKSGFVFYREKPSMQMQINIRYQVERRLEELVAAEFTNLTVGQFRQIKQPLTLNFKNVYDPHETSADLSAWVGLFFGAVIFVFIFLFGMTILRSVAREKSNRIVEVILASVSSRSLMFGKIVGIGVSAFIQFAIWIGLISLGLYFMRSQIFVDAYDPANAAEQVQTVSNEFVSLVYERIQFSAMLPYFFLFFVVGYLFYGAFFAALGAVSGSESDGQQFLIPLIALLCFSLYAGYSVAINPDSASSDFYAYLPFTAPIVMMVKLAQGFGPDEGYQLYLSLFVTLLFAIGMLLVAGRLYKNGLLQFGHSVRLRTIFSWIKMK